MPLSVFSLSTFVKKLNYYISKNGTLLTLCVARNRPKLCHAEFDRGGAQIGPKLPHILGSTVSVTTHL